jgi:hypothetical protein
VAWGHCSREVLGVLGKDPYIYVEVIVAAPTTDSVSIILLQLAVLH